jgi:hypothetical protein
MFVMGDVDLTSGKTDADMVANLLSMAPNNYNLDTKLKVQTRLEGQRNFEICKRTIPELLQVTFEQQKN